MEKKKKVAIIGTNGLPANYGGFETLVNYLTLNLSQDFELYVFCPKTIKQNRIESINGAKQIYLPFKANGAQSIIYDICSILKALLFADTLLILGTSGAIILPFIKILKKNIIVNFGGLEWKRDKWSLFIRKYLKLSEKYGVIFSDKIVADNNSFKEYISKEYSKDSIVIEYGGDHTKKILSSTEDLLKYPFLKEDYYVSVSRAQPDNNLHLVLEAFSKLPDKNLVLVSNWNKFQYGIELREKYKGFKNLFLLDAIYNLEELDLIRGNAKVYIHSHSFCGTAPSLVEAMNLSLPVFSYNADTNRATTENTAPFFNNSDDLIKIIERYSNDDLVKLSIQMKEIASRRYTWDIISRKYAELF